MEKEKEKKIRDLTGNQQERIAPKSPEKGRSSRPSIKRPQVRMADGSQPAPEEKKGAEGKEDSSSRGKRRFDRGDRRNRGDRNRGDRRREENATHSEAPAGTENTARSEGAARTENAHGERSAQPSQGRRSRNDRKARNEKRRNDPRQDDTRREETPQNAEGKRETPQKSQGRHPERSGQSDRGDRGVANARRKRDTAAEATQELFRRSDAGSEPAEVTFTDEELRADGLLFTLDEPEAEVSPAAADAELPKEPEEQFEVVGIRFRGAGKVYYFSPNGIAFSEGDHAVLETVRGMEYGEVAHGNLLVNASEVVQPLKPVLRKATAEDDEHYRANLEKEQKARPIFEEKVSKNRLEMQLVDVEYTFDNTKLCFYFTAEGRVDFRELVKDLASVFRTRIELRQIGVRDEARMFGGLGVCGRPFCCKSFLSDFVQVSIKMAKEQNLSLASAKISGSCGRLMCCLRYEQDTYERENAALPRPNSIVSTPKGRATVLESSFLTGNVKVLLTEENAVRVFSTSEVKLLEPPRGKGNSNRGQADAGATAVAATEETGEGNPPQENA